mgnify:CR=1 FL=1
MAHDRPPADQQGEVYRPVRVADPFGRQRAAGRTIQREAAKCGRTIEILLEIHVADEETKSGWEIGELMRYVGTAPFARMPDICVRGVMGIATNTDDGGLSAGISRS